MSYSIELSDGTVLDNLTINGDNFVSRYPITTNMFEHNMSPVTISSDGSENNLYITLGVHPNMDLVQITHKEGSNEWMFAIRDLSESELQYAKIRSEIEYMAMMMDIEL